MRSQDSSLPNLKFSDDPLMIRVGWPFLKREREREISLPRGRRRDQQAGREQRRPFTQLYCRGIL